MHLLNEPDHSNDTKRASPDQAYTFERSLDTTVRAVARRPIGKRVGQETEATRHQRKADIRLQTKDCTFAREFLHPSFNLPEQASLLNALEQLVDCKSTRAAMSHGSLFVDAGSAAVRVPLLTARHC
jgi:hypothetical protein